MKQDKIQPLKSQESTTVSLERQSENNETVLLADSNETVLLSDSNETMLLDDFLASQTVHHSRELYQLKEGDILSGRYVIGDILGFGGFGITYSAWDKKLEVKVAIKEYYPANLVNRIPGRKEVEIYSSKKQEEFHKGLTRFLGEAQNMAKFSGQKNIVNVFNYFKENNTAYLVMEFLDGVSLKEYTKQQGEKLPYTLVIEFTKCVISALKVLHKQHIIHRDISPDNIFICRDGTVKLIDFGAARFATDSDEQKTLSVVLKPGFAPPEQYRSKGKQGPWTDIYALGATMYRTVTGVVPDESVNRTVKDELKEPKEYVPEIPEYFNRILMKCIALNPELRFQNVDELEQKIDRKKTVKSVQTQLRQRKMVRGVLIVTAVGVLGFVGYSEYRYVQSLQNKANLVPGTISVWVPLEEGEKEAEMAELFESGIAAFQEAYPMVTVEATYIPEKEYEEKLNQAIKSGDAPTVFESSFLSQENAGCLESLSDAYEMFEDGQMQFQNFTEAYYQQKQLPTGFSVPIIFENTLLADEDAVYAKTNDKQAFIDGESAVYVGTYEDYSQIQGALAGVYTTQLAETGQIEFLHVWGVNADSSEDQQNAGERLLYYMAGEEAGDVWYVQNENGFPLQADSLDTYMDVNSEFSYLKEIQISSDGAVTQLDEEGLENIYQSIVRGDRK